MQKQSFAWSFRQLVDNRAQALNPLENSPEATEATCMQRSHALPESTANC